MPNKNEKKNATKKTTKKEKTLMLRLDNGAKVPAKIVYVKDNSKCFKINEIDINKIRVSKKRLYSKKYNSYKYYVLYEHDNDYVPLRVTLKDVVGYCSVYDDSKKMNFNINNESYDRLINIL